MSRTLRLDLLLKEIKDEYVQENFRKLKRYLNCLEDKINEAGTSEGDTNITIGSPTAFFKNDFVADAPYLANRVTTLSDSPTLNSERIYLNGLILSDDCYIISGSQLTLDAGLDLEIGDEIFVRYAS